MKKVYILLVRVLVRDKKTAENREKVSAKSWLQGLIDTENSYLWYVCILL